MTDIITRFEYAIQSSSMSPLEIAWSTKINDPEALKEILNGKQIPNEQQSESIERFIRKSYRR